MMSNFRPIMTFSRIPLSFFNDHYIIIMKPSSLVVKVSQASNWKCKKLSGVKIEDFLQSILVANITKEKIFTVYNISNL